MYEENSGTQFFLCYSYKDTNLLNLQSSCVALMHLLH